MQERESQELGTRIYRRGERRNSVERLLFGWVQTFKPTSLDRRLHKWAIRMGHHRFDGAKRRDFCLFLCFQWSFEAMVQDE
jgi:hypothetical protein